MNEKNTTIKNQNDIDKTDGIVINVLRKERSNLIRILSESEEGIKKAPPGSVQVKKHKKGIQFFQRLDPHDKNGSYMPVSEKNRAYALVQKRYLYRLKKAAEEQVKVIDSFLKRYDPDATGKVYINENEVRQNIIKPLVLPDSLYADEWQQFEYEKKPFYQDDAVHFTQKNERVRSKSEVLIANALAVAGLQYRYECPLKIGGNIIYPDFTILDLRDRREIYWEHLGMMDDAEYCNHAIARIRTYEANGIIPGKTLILTSETSKLPLNLPVINQIIKSFFALS